MTLLPLSLAVALANEYGNGRLTIGFILTRKWVTE